jgi:hypothetical protein
MKLRQTDRQTNLSKTVKAVKTYLVPRSSKYKCHVGIIHTCNIQSFSVYNSYSLRKPKPIQGCSVTAVADEFLSITRQYMR